MSEVDQEKAKQENVKTDNSTCDHVGYYIGFGMEISVDQSGVHVITAQSCMMCGETFIKLTTLKPTPSSNIATKSMLS